MIKLQFQFSIFFIYIFQIESNLTLHLIFKNFRLSNKMLFMNSKQINKNMHEILPFFPTPSPNRILIITKLIFFK